MSQVTLGSLIDLIRSNRIAREENVRTMNDGPPDERPLRRPKSASRIRHIARRSGRSTNCQRCCGSRRTPEVPNRQ